MVPLLIKYVRTMLRLRSSIQLSTRLKLFTSRKAFLRLTSYEEYTIFVIRFDLKPVLISNFVARQHDQYPAVENRNIRV